MANQKFFFLFSFLSLISFIYSAKCEINTNHCLKCNEVTNLCSKCDMDVLIPDENGGCMYSNHCQIGKNYCNECDLEEKLCKTCEPGYFPDKNGGCSYAPNCLASYKGECLECDENFIMIGKMEEENGFKFCKYKLSSDFLNCKTINTTTGYCEACEDNYYLNSGDKRCIKIENCYESAFGVCTECDPIYYLYKKEDRCVRKEYPFILCKETLDGEKCVRCDDDGFLAEDGVCVDTNYCSVSYKTKLNCKECMEGYYLAKDKRACTNEVNCQHADKETGLCIECLDGFYLTKNRKCESNKEDNIFKHCKIAKEDYCTECLWDYYLGGDNQCSPSPNCTEISNGVCIYCEEGFYLGKDNICTTVEHCSKSDYYKNCVECEENYYFDLSDKTCKESTNQFANCLESNMEGNKCHKCRSKYYLSLVDNMCYSNEEKGTFYKCELSTMDGKQCDKCIEGYYTGLKDSKCTEGYVCLYSDEDHVCQECREDYCLNRKNGKCYKNYEFIDEKVYFKCLKTNVEGTSCEKCAEKFEPKNGLCYNLEDCELAGEDTCNKCKDKDYEDNPLCLNENYGCIETLRENCLKCDDLSDSNFCTQCAEGYTLNDYGECI